MIGIIFLILPITIGVSSWYASKYIINNICHNFPGSMIRYVAISCIIFSITIGAICGFVVHYQKDNNMEVTGFSLPVEKLYSKYGEPLYMVPPIEVGILNMILMSGLSMLCISILIRMFLSEKKTRTELRNIYSKKSIKKENQDVA